MAVILPAMLAGCSKDNNTTTPDPGPVTPIDGYGRVTMTFANYVGNTPLSLNNSQGYAYTNANGDSFNVSAYKYYISNIKFVREDGYEYAEPESYHFIDEADPASLSFSVPGLMPGKYTAVKLLIGVDSARNVSGAQTGALDPIHGMFWTWSTGYIMAKMEGNFKNTDNGNKSGFSYHLGGFKGEYRVVNEITLSLPQDLVAGNNTASSMTLRSNVLEWFAFPSIVKLNEINQVGSVGPIARGLSLSFSQSFSVTKVEN
ncbi:MbnP family protein [Taibaiella koreensis]|uniref:MbnP family protein n=1 Tax=Taibaiella koreensis TaxID=1268548 RepID=UPI000E59E316|nr:MbnP family protein [Taibaiella koreensis]